MPNNPTNLNLPEQRIRASWRTRAVAAGWCVGAQIFLSGCAVGLPLALNGTWLASLASLPFCAWLVSRCVRHLRTGQSHHSRAGYLLLAVSLLGCGVFACSSLVVFAAQTLVQQSRPIWTEAAALLGVLLCALSGGTGAARLCFALRYAAAALILGLSLISLPMRMPVGLFPILGAGIKSLSLSALCMLFGASPALMLMLPPPELSGSQSEQAVPPLSFFLRRVLFGALVGAALLFLTCTGATHESIARSSELGARLRMAAGNQPHEGILQMILILTKLIAMILLAANMLCAAQQALGAAIPALQQNNTGLLATGILLALALAIPAICGDMPLLIAAPLITVPATLSAGYFGRRPRA